MDTGNKQQPIFILGFGRSGTTWISDIVSKVLGGLILFEPLHPATTHNADQFCYASGLDPSTSNLLYEHLNLVMAKQLRNRWLLRNHVFAPIHEVSDDFLAQLWNECEVIGFKAIRANFMIDWLIDHFHPKIVYITRHPGAVVASILRRPRFWEEFGWEQHYQMFLNRTIQHSKFEGIFTRSQLKRIEMAQTLVEKYALMWSVTHKLIHFQLAKHGIPIFFYENFYAEPFGATRRLFQYLELSTPHIHPSHIFTPSMMTLRTVHGLYNEECRLEQQGEAYFWSNELADDQVRTIINIAIQFDIHIYDEVGFIGQPDPIYTNLS